MVNSPLTRPYFFRGGVPLDSGHRTSADSLGPQVVPTDGGRFQDAGQVGHDFSSKRWSTDFDDRWVWDYMGPPNEGDIYIYRYIHWYISSIYCQLGDYMLPTVDG